MKYLFFLLFTFPALLITSCRPKRSGVPRVLIYTKNAGTPETAAVTQAIQQLGDINKFIINPAVDNINLL